MNTELKKKAKTYSEILWNFWNDYGDSEES